MSGQCQALYLSDERRCEAAATSKDGLFCRYHTRQCFGLYKGYKRRNAQLDDLIANPPVALKNISLHELNVAAIKDERVLDEIREHLQRRYALLDRVIRARRLHHSRFYTLKLDYGHEQYLNQLLSQKTPVLRTLESITKRLAEILYQKQKWFAWVRKLEDEEENERDAEKKKVKQEAALFKRHAREVEARLAHLKADEDEKSQSDYLNKVWEERQKEIGEIDENNVEDMWDPVEDSIEEERETYLDLLRHFLWQETMADKNSGADTADAKQQKSKVVSVQPEYIPWPGGQDNAAAGEIAGVAKSKSAKKRARQKTNATTKSKEQAAPGQVHIETQQEMRERLSVGQTYQDGVRWAKGGTFLKPTDSKDKSPSLDADEIDVVIDEIAEIKQLLLCRILLSHAPLLSIALRANSVDEFLVDDQVANADLRDLCLKMEQPDLQLLRDACADLRREDDRPGEEQADVEHDLENESTSILKTKLPRSFETKREKGLKERREKFLPSDGTMIDFGDIDDQKQYRGKKVKIRVCGRTIWNYPSEKAMSRGGWFHFSIIAKDCRLEDAVRLCRNWDEFNELVFLTMHNYFPASGWISFLGGFENQQLFKLGFFPTFRMDKAEDFSQYHQSSRNQNQRVHQVFEMRNWVCGQMKRNDAVTRRFLQYLALSTSELVLFVRDVATGKILVKPPEDQLWLVRYKAGAGRASKNQFETVRSVGPKFIEEMEAHRQWDLDFREYYEIVIWDVEVGQPFPSLYNTIQRNLFKAHRNKAGIEIWQPFEHIMRSLTVDREQRRALDIKSGDDVKSLWDIFTDQPSLRLVSEDPKGDGSGAEFPEEWIYNEADQLEDEVLFPWEHSGVDDGALLVVRKGAMHGFENNGPQMNRFILDLDTDDETSETDLIQEVDRLRERQETRRANDDEEEDEDEEDEFDQEDLESETASEDSPDRPLSREETAAARAMLVASNEWHDSGGQSEPQELNIAGNLSTRQITRLRKREEQRQKQLEEEAMQEDFQLFIDRERATVFKECWHKADLELGAQKRWSDYQHVAKTLIQWLQHPEMTTPSYQNLAQTFRLLTILQIDDFCHRRVVKDAVFACAFVPLFFGNTTFLDMHREFKDLSLFNQTERARHEPDRRSSMSCGTRPNVQFKEWDDRKGRQPRYLAEWEKVMRPIIAHLYREGVICSSYLEGVTGPSICLTEPGRQPDLFFDWRAMVQYLNASGSLINPHKITPLVDQARSYAEYNPKARFSVLRIWSAPHFWPLMLGFDNRENTSFADSLGRHWEWKFIPKDMPCAEWSVHKIVGDRFNYELLHDRALGKVVHRMDTVLICAKTEESCELLTKASFFAVNTKPWRLEVDPWKSWFNVDIKFLEGLHKKWWE